MNNLRYPCLKIPNLVRTYAFKSNLKIKWVRPEKILSYKPAKSGDLEAFPNINQTQPQLKFKDCKELHDADALVKKLFSLEFAPHSSTVIVGLEEIRERVKRHDYDMGSIEARIARWTGAIRAMQETMETHPRNKGLKVQLQELIDRRRKHLNYLRRWDYKKFEWLLENLNIEFKPYPTGDKKVTRKGSLVKLTEKYCDDFIKSKLDEYKAVLQAEQPAFLEEKIRMLEFIRDEQKECGVKVTVTEEEIDNVKKQLDDLKKANISIEKED